MKRRVASSVLFVVWCAACAQEEPLIVVTETFVGDVPTCPLEGIAEID